VKILGVLNTRVKAAHADHRAIFKSMAWVTLFVLIGRLAGAAKEMVVAYRYGVGAEIDAYLFVMNFIGWPIGLWFSVLTAVLVPLAARMRQDAAEELPRFRAELLGATLVLGLVLAVFSWLVLPMILQSSWADLPPATAAIATEAVPALSLLVPLGVVVSLFSAWMLSAGRHANTLFEGIPALVIILALFMFATGGIVPLLWGTVAGSVFHLISLVVSLARRNEVVAPRFAYRSSQWTAFWNGFGIMLAGQALMSLVVIIDQFFAVHLDTGAVATLSYANRVLALLVGMVGIAVSRATLPIFSQAHAGERGHVHRIATQWTHIMFLIGLAAMILLWWLAPYVVALLFERGAFTQQDTFAVSTVLRYGAIQLPFLFAGLVLVSSLVSRGMHRLVAYGAGINLLVKIGANYLLVPDLGINGVMLATGVMYFASFSMLYGLALYVGTQKEDIRCG
jgi:putative peptidoglycan lipid II flippase